MQKIWLKQYPAGVPPEIRTDVYPSLVALPDDSFRNYRDLAAYKFMGASFSFGAIGGTPQREILPRHPSRPLRVVATLGDDFPSSTGRSDRWELP